MKDHIKALFRFYYLCFTLLWSRITYFEEINTFVLDFFVLRKQIRSVYNNAISSGA